MLYMKKIQIIILLLLAMASVDMSAKTLVVYYSYTGNCHEIVQTLISQIDADTLRIYPADKTQHYEANNYALGTQLLNAIYADPTNPDSYPAIDPVSISLADYNNFIIVTPLWWSHMAAILQTYLFHHGSEMAGKNVGLIVSSYSSGISGVVADAQRLVPEAEWMGNALWINNANHRNRESLIKNWLIAIDYDALTAEVKGDVNGDRATNISDVMALIDMLLNGDAYQPDADVNADGSVSISDVSSLTDYLLSGTW
jgi:flavodoxin